MMLNRLIIPYPHPSVTVAVAKGDADNAVERLVKYVPTEIISGYVFLNGIIGGVVRTSPLRIPAAWSLFACGLVGTWYYMKLYRPQGLQRLQLPISTASFALWAYALGGPFTMGPPLLGAYPYEGWFASFLAGLYGIGIAMFWKPVNPVPPPQQAPNPLQAVPPTIAVSPTPSSPAASGASDGGHNSQEQTIAPDQTSI